MNSTERRATPRKGVWIAFTIDGRNTPPGDCIERLSLTGAFIRTVQPLAPRTRISIRLTSPKKNEKHRFDAEVIRMITPQEAPGAQHAPGMGIEFLNLGDGDPRPHLREILTEQDTLRKASKLEITTPSSGDNPSPQQQLANILSVTRQGHPYNTLQVEPDADNKALKKAYYRLCKSVHPDRFRKDGPTIASQAEEAYQRVSEAYETLHDPELRRRYDEEHGVYATLEWRKKKAQKHINNANSALKSGRKVRAALELRLALSIQPNADEANTLLEQLNEKESLFLT